MPSRVWVVASPLLPQYVADSSVFGSLTKALDDVTGSAYGDTNVGFTLDNTEEEFLGGTTRVNAQRLYGAVRRYMRQPERLLVSVRAEGSYSDQIWYIIEAPIQ
jgi:hypothetical protein